MIKNPYFDEFLKLEGDIFKRYSSRGKMVEKYAWAIPNNETIDIIKKYSPIVEIGAGTGYWAYMMDQVRIDIVAYDKEPYKNGYCEGKWLEVKKGGSEKVKDHPKRALFLCWPPYEDPMAHEAIRFYKGDTIIYIGESSRGCTGDDKFHEELYKYWEEIEEYRIPQWLGLHDRLFIYKRRKWKIKSYKNGNQSYRSA